MKEVYLYLKDLFANMPDNVVLKEYSSSKQELVKLETFEETVNKYSGGK